MISGDGWNKYNTWEHSTAVKELYARRCRLEEEEMTCAAQAAEILSPHVSAGDVLLDAGCGSGYFYHSLKKRNIRAQYFGIDAAPSLIEIGRTHLPRFGLLPENLRVVRIEDLDGEADHIVCLNVLSNLDNYHKPLNRLLRMARKTLVLRESCGSRNRYRFVRDRYLDDGIDLKVYVNTYNSREFMDFIASYGFRVGSIQDRFTQGKMQRVIGYAHYWKFFFAQRVH
jgi:ubiquinone/menaquinone biosynthesis C-methylase UbiE